MLERIKKLYPSLIDLSLGRLEKLLEKLGRPQDHLPPVFHVAGTNGKGSTCAFLRAMGESVGLRAHVLTSPHLISLNERFRIAGKLVDNATLEEALAEIEIKNAGAPITVFEVLTAVGFLLFSRTQADFTIVEVGMGGKFDATNLVNPAVCLITPISYDHQNFLGDKLSGIVAEKAGIIKENIPVYAGKQVQEALVEIEKAAQSAHAPLEILGQNFKVSFKKDQQSWIFLDEDSEISLPFPALKGLHQIENAALAIAAFKNVFPQYSPKAFEGIAVAKWPGRLQQLTGKLKNLIPENWELWLDGAHNPHGAEFLGKMFQSWKEESPNQKIYVILGLKEGKKASEILVPLLPWGDKILLVCEENQYLAQTVTAMHQELEPMGETVSIEEAASVRAALQKLALENRSLQKNRIVICGSLYLAGEVLRQDGFEMV
ncbi:bifunctional folylpolyglutamate synthase/dihydrofolate synthase [Acetobacteraceae bacterium]|nr:bifunctional folylpolyglutamate synthase/dihydrofolate synthase [Acetobacteraceae bacterium]